MDRTYTCFVCGERFTDYEPFAAHVVEKHEFGRDYVVCPVPHCKAPVRDAVLHLKVKHPQYDHRTYDGPARAQIYRCVGSQKKGQRPKIKQGKYESTKMGRVFTFRSGWERTVFGILDESSDVVGFDVEPYRIGYFHKGKSREYVPDIWVVFRDGTKELWEVKPKSQVKSPVNQDKFAAAQAACVTRGWMFRVITEDSIAKLKSRLKRDAPLREG